jgi:hypothetical protein
MLAGLIQSINSVILTNLKGHNIKLLHSGEGTGAYSDQSGLMVSRLGAVMQSFKAAVFVT